MKDPLTWLQEWYLEQCDGEWEHRDGIKIGTLDNPGWWVEIDIAGTRLHDLSVQRTLRERSENDWIAHEVTAHKFVGHCGPLCLNELIGIFKKYCEDTSRH